MLRLGNSPRALAEKELDKTRHLLEVGRLPEADFLLQAGGLYRSMSFFSREAGTWDEFLRKYPDHPQAAKVAKAWETARIQWAYLFYEQGRPTAALEILQGTVERRPAAAEAWSWIGRIHLEQGRKTKARVAYQQMLAVSPGNPVARHFLRVIGRTARASR